MKIIHYTKCHKELLVNARGEGQVKNETVF